MKCNICGKEFEYDEGFEKVVYIIPHNNKKYRKYSYAIKMCVECVKKEVEEDE